MNKEDLEELTKAAKRAAHSFDVLSKSMLDFKHVKETNQIGSKYHA